LLTRPQHLSAKDGDVSLATVLLQRGARVESATRRKQTPLHFAATGGHVDIITLLLEHGVCRVARGGETAETTLADGRAQARWWMRRTSAGRPRSIWRQATAVWMPLGS
jgi:hypothetical protein